MDASLKSIVVPHLRELGFSGSFPHFRRIKENGIDLISFQFDKYGGGFVIEVSHCPPGGITTSWGKEIPPDKVQAWDMPFNLRLRIQPGTGHGPGSWFRYDTLSLVANTYDRLSRKVIELLKEKATPFWNQHR
jgi:hypothetical protein